MPVTRSFDVFFDLRLKNSWVNTREAGDLRHYRANYDIIVMLRGIQNINKLHRFIFETDLVVLVQLLEFH